MKALETLIKLHRQDLDEKKRKLTALEAQKDQLQEAIINLIKELRKEQQIVTGNSELAFAYANYATNNRSKQQKLALEMVQVNEIIDKLRDELFNIFSELKKYEIALANKQQQIKHEEERQETIYLDEVAINGFIRKDND